MVERHNPEKGVARRRAVLEAAAREMEATPHFQLHNAASRVNMRKSIFHYYFESKQKLTHAVFHEIPRTPALFCSLLALSLEDSYLREELVKELSEQVGAIGPQMTAQAIGQQVMSVLGVSTAEAAE